MMAITETKLSKLIMDTEIKLDGFKLYWSDRKGSIRGDVMFYLRSDMFTMPVETYIDGNGNDKSLIMKGKIPDELVIVPYRSQA